MPPRICPPPPDCPLYTQRVDYTQDEPLRRALLMERRKSNALASLVWADFNRDYQRPAPSPPTRPALPSPLTTVPPLPLQKDKEVNS